MSFHVLDLSLTICSKGTVVLFMMTLVEVLLIARIFIPDIRTPLPCHCTLRENKAKTGHLLLLKVLLERYWGDMKLRY